MRSLRFVHLAGDGSHLVLETADGGEQFVLAADPDVRQVLGGGATRAPEPVVAAPPAVPVAVAPTGAPDRTENLEVSPREIQTRIRAGESPAELAASLGTSLERISRFAGPVVEERLRIADEARRARARRGAGGGADGQPAIFGELVDERFAAHGVATSEVTWDAYRRDDGEWVVRASWHRGETAYDAAWLFHRSSRSVTPLDDSATDLLSDRPIRPVLPVPAPAPALAPGVVAFPPMPEALTGPLPVLEDVFDQDAQERFDAQDFAFEEPPLPLGIVDPTTRPGAAGARLSSVRNLGGGKREESDEERAARVKVPSWDDILLGVRRKQD